MVRGGPANRAVKRAKIFALTKVRADYGASEAGSDFSMCSVLCRFRDFVDGGKTATVLLSGQLIRLCSMLMLGEN